MSRDQYEQVLVIKNQIGQAWRAYVQQRSAAGVVQIKCLEQRLFALQAESQSQHKEQQS